MGGGDMAVGGEAGGQLVGAAGGGGMLPPPCDAGLLLPTCCHLLCTDLAGERQERRRASHFLSFLCLRTTCLFIPYHP